ncbi:MAG: LysR family transcriptional regulator [Chloroflexales bacterium]|nr:LysR family transcriptional regulator [Chloroflexales bacterium]
MDINTLAIFVETMRKRSFTAVANDHNVDPTTISRAIAALERELKLRLFHRTTRIMQPTEAGMVYFERVEPLVDELQKAQLAAADVNDRPHGVLRVACPASFAELNITPLVPAFAQQYPELRFEFVLTDALVDLVTEQLDVAIRIGPLHDSTLIAHKLCPMVARVCATAAYLRSHGHPQLPEDLAQHRCLLLALPGFSRSNWKFTDPTGQTTEVAVNALLRTSNAMALKQCALAGMGITLQARWMVGRELRAGTLIDVFPDYAVTAALDDAAAWLVYPSRKYVPQKVQVFVDFLRQHFDHGPPGDRPTHENPAR